MARSDETQSEIRYAMTHVYDDLPTIVGKQELTSFAAKGEPVLAPGDIVKPDISSSSVFLQWRREYFVEKTLTGKARFGLPPSCSSPTCPGTECCRLDGT